ncbi:MAG TPA: hypothetical protein V6C86_06090 [Oculatellaceae cyanobacterium]
MHNHMDIRSFLMHRLQAGSANGDDVAGELQRFLELERQSRIPQDEDTASVATLIPSTGRHLRVVS